MNLWDLQRSNHLPRPFIHLVEISWLYDVSLKLMYLIFFPATNGVVLASEKKHKSVLYDEHSIHKVELITKNIGMVYSGMGPDYR